MAKPDLIVCVVSCSAWEGSGGHAAAPDAPNAAHALDALVAAAEAVPELLVVDASRDTERTNGRAQLTYSGSDEALLAGARACAGAAAEIAFVPVGRGPLVSAMEHARSLASSLKESLSQGSAAGASVVARRARVVFHVEFDRQDSALAEQLSSRVSAGQGGFPEVSASALPAVPGRGSELEVRLLDPGRTPLVPVFSALEILSREAGSMCVASRLQGLAPRAVLSADMAEEIQMHDFDADTHHLERVARRSLQQC